MLHCLPICACVIVLVCISCLSVPGWLYKCFYFRTCATVFVCTTEPHRVTDVTVARTYVKACQATFSMNSQFLSSFNEKYCCYSQKAIQITKNLCSMYYALFNNIVGLLSSFRWFRLSSFNILYCLCCWLSQVHFTKSCQPNIRAKMLEGVVVWLASASPPFA